MTTQYNRREQIIAAMLAHIERFGLRVALPADLARQRVMAAIQPGKSATFRKGKSGGWREYFTEEHKKLFKDVAGDLLIRLGYEKDNDW